MNLLTWLKFGHILGAIIWIGGGVILSLIGIRTRQSEDPHYIREFSRTLSYVGLRVLMPAVIAVLAFGVWMMFISPAWRFTQLWILFALGAFALAFVIGAVYLSSRRAGAGKTHRRYGVRFEGSPRSAQPLDRRLPDRTARSHLCCVGHGF